jgi:hypothetical protein
MYVVVDCTYEDIDSVLRTHYAHIAYEEIMLTTQRRLSLYRTEALAIRPGPDHSDLGWQLSSTTKSYSPI